MLCSSLCHVAVYLLSLGEHSAGRRHVIQSWGWTWSLILTETAERMLRGLGVTTPRWYGHRAVCVCVWGWQLHDPCSLCSLRPERQQVGGGGGERKGESEWERRDSPVSSGQSFHHLLSLGGRAPLTPLTSTHRCAPLQPKSRNKCQSNPSPWSP